MKTKEKILLKSLELFNQLGEPNVTTLDVATELEISPGNLYYHFKGKDEIIEVLFQRFESDILDLQMHRVESDAVLLDLWTYLQFSFEVMAEYLFLFRDVADLLSRYQKLQRKFNGVLAAQRRTLLLLANGLVEEGSLTASNSELSHLVEHMTMTMSFWLNYQRVQAHDMHAFEPDLADCAYQVIAQLLPYLEHETRLEVQAIASEYL
ncbi:MAG: TetR/AcrR family transcriptional regulator [Pseudomonadales bacterium]